MDAARDSVVMDRLADEGVLMQMAWDRQKKLMKAFRVQSEVNKGFQATEEARHSILKPRNKLDRVLTEELEKESLLASNKGRYGQKELLSTDLFAPAADLSIRLAQTTIHVNINHDGAQSAASATTAVSGHHSQAGGMHGHVGVPANIVPPGTVPTPAGYPHGFLSAGMPASPSALGHAAPHHPMGTGIGVAGPPSVGGVHAPMGMAGSPMGGVHAPMGMAGSPMGGVHAPMGTVPHQQPHTPVYGTAAAGHAAPYAQHPGGIPQSGHYASTAPTMQPMHPQHAHQQPMTTHVGAVAGGMGHFAGHVGGAPMPGHVYASAASGDNRMISSNVLSTPDFPLGTLGPRGMGSLPQATTYIPLQRVQEPMLTSFTYHQTPRSALDASVFLRQKPRQQPPATPTSAAVTAVPHTTAQQQQQQGSRQPTSQAHQQPGQHQGTQQGPQHQGQQQSQQRH